MRNIILAATFALSLTPYSALAGGKPEQYSSCNFNFEDGMKLSWLSVSTSASMDGFEDVDEFMYGIMCKWRPNSTFLIGGQVKDAQGYLQMEELSDGRNKIAVTVDGCTFNMTFGKQGSKFNVSDDKTKCDNPKSHGGVDNLYPISDGHYGVSCKDGTSTPITLNDGVYCAIPKDNRSSKCETNTSFSLMAEWVCQ